MSSLMQSLQPWFAAAFTVWGSPVTWIEIIGFVLAVWMVICNMQIRPLAWPLAMLSSALYFLLFWNSRLYGDAVLQLAFIVLAGWGWWQWLRGRAEGGGALQVRALSRQGRWAVVLAVLTTWPLVGLFLKQHTDTDVPFWDAFPTAGSLVGQWLLGRKYLENWAVWVAVNVVAVSLFAFKGLWLTVLLYTLFTIMAVMGWRAWRSKLRDSHAAV